MTETVARWVGRLLGRDDLTRIDEADLSFGASWAHDGPGWVLLAVVAAAALVFGNEPFTLVDQRHQDAADQVFA